MSQHSETMGSFIRTGSYPLEADLIFDSYTSLQEWAKENEQILHEGLHKVVIEDGEQKLYWAVKEGDSFIFEEFSSGDSGLEQDITAMNITVGNITSGTTLPAGSTLTQILLKMLVKPSRPTYTISNVRNGSTNLSTPIEVGTPVTGAVGSYIINQAGSHSSVTATLTGFVDKTTPTATLSGGTVTITFTGRIAEGTNTVSSTVNYNASTLFPEITASSVSASKSITGARQYFRGNGEAPTTNSAIRAATKGLAASSFTYALNSGSTQMWIAIPSTKKITSVTDAGALNAVITGNFVKISTIMIDGATSGKDSINYDIYQMADYGPFGSAHNITFNIA